MHVRAALVEGPVGAETHTPAHPHGQSAPERTFPQRPERPAIDETDSPHTGRYGLTKTNRHAPCNLTKQNRPVIPTDKNRQKRIEQSVHQPQQTAEAENEPSAHRAVRPAGKATVVLRCPMLGREKRRTLRDTRPPSRPIIRPSALLRPLSAGPGRTNNSSRSDRPGRADKSGKTHRPDKSDWPGRISGKPSSMPLDPATARFRPSGVRHTASNVRVEIRYRHTVSAPGSTFRAHRSPELPEGKQQSRE
ncbi:hypothetical protein BN3659_01834 [Alistipes sp. CHKCI003]|nr:hypothetical protein BN3659_01834 [Alistipes sp. CHKCI003]